jgi:hypothetical protein
MAAPGRRPGCSCTAGVSLLLALSMPGCTRPFSAYPNTGVVRSSTMSCAGQRPVVRPWRWAWGLGLGRRGVGQCPTGPWLLHQELGAAGAHSTSWRRHLVRAVQSRRVCCWRRRLSRSVGRRLRPGLQSACVPLSRRCMPQFVGHHLRASPPAGRSCRRPWRCRAPTGSRPRESAARLRSWRR